MGQGPAFSTSSWTMLVSVTTPGVTESQADPLTWGEILEWTLVKKTPALDTGSDLQDQGVQVGFSWRLLVLR